MTIANVADVSTRLGRPITSADEIAQVNAWLTDAENLILARIPDLLERVADGKPSADVVKAIEANAVIRKIQNPEGKVAEGVDDYNYRFNEHVRRGEIFLTDDEWGLLLPGSPDGAWTIRPAGHGRRRGTWVHPDVWVPLP